MPKVTIAAESMAQLRAIVPVAEAVFERSATVRSVVGIVIAAGVESMVRQLWGGPDADGIVDIIGTIGNSDPKLVCDLTAKMVAMGDAKKREEAQRRIGFALPELG